NISRIAACGGLPDAQAAGCPEGACLVRRYFHAEVRTDCPRWAALHDRADVCDAGQPHPVAAVRRAAHRTAAYGLLLPDVRDRVLPVEALRLRLRVNGVALVYRGR